MTISDERLEYLRSRRERYAAANRKTGSPVAGQEDEDIANALKELQQRRFNERNQSLAAPSRFVPSGGLNNSPDILSKCRDCGTFLGHDHVCLY